MFLGKTIMCVAVAYAGRYSYTFIRDVFASSGVVGGLASTLLLAAIVYAMIKIDWEKYVDIKKPES